VNPTHKEKSLITAESFKTFLFEECLPEIKRLHLLSHKKKYHQQSLDKAVQILNKIYNSAPEYLKDLDTSLSAEIQANMSHDQIEFLMKCHELLKISKNHADFNINNLLNEDYGGHCFRAAYVFITNHQHLENLLLVHGWVYNSLIGKYMAHAWVEENETLVHDLSQDKGARTLARSEFYNLAETDQLQIRRYNLEQVLEFGKSTGHYGPWDEDLFAQEFKTTEEYNLHT